MQWHDYYFRVYQYLRYRTLAVNEFRIHSPFIFEFATRVLYDKQHYAPYDEIERLRKELLNDDAVLEVVDYGAGSTTGGGSSRKVGDIARHSLKPPRYAQLLFRAARYYKPVYILELGTSLGLTTSYLAHAYPAAQVTTLEGSPEIARRAQKHFDRFQLDNIRLITGSFDDKLPTVLHDFSRLDFVYIDGNHRKAPTLRYFEDILPLIHNDTVVVFDDIYWSRDMASAWHALSHHPSVSASVDLFSLGFLFFKQEIKAQEHFVLRF